MYNLLLATILCVSNVQDPSPSYGLQMRIQQTQPQYSQPFTPLPPGCGPFWDSQRATQSLPSYPQYNQLHYYYPYYQQHLYYPYYRIY